MAKKKRPRSTRKTRDAGSPEGGPPIEVGAIVHDLRNVFSAIRGTATVVRDELRPGDPKREDIDLILKAVDRGLLVSHRLSALRTPARPEAPAAQPPPGAEEGRLDPSDAWALRSPKRSASILVIEDDDLLRTMIVRLLHRNGYATLEAGNGAEAEERALAHGLAVDLLLVDVGLPGPSGPEIVERLKPRWPAVKVLFMSGFGRAALAERGLRPGPHLLEKPFSPPTLLERIEAMLALGTS